MATFQGLESHIHNIVRGFLMHGDEIILCRVKNAEWFFLPGGHIEDGESASVALLRELHEEIGENDYKIRSFVGVCETVFPLEENLLQHEIDIVFEVDVPVDSEIKTKENHIEFVSVSKKDLGNYKILPTTLKDGLLEWIENGKPFFEGILDMEIKSSLVNRLGQTLPIIYRDIDSLDDFSGRKVDAVRAYCFCGNELVIVYSDAKGYWTPPGGGVEPGETVEEAVVREVLEETNMRVLKQKPIGTLEIFEPEQTKFQVRLVCIVEPVGPFVADTDPEGDITEIKLINPKDIKQYFDWGEVGEHVLARALELRNLE